MLLPQVEECEMPKSPREKEIIDDIFVRWEDIAKLFHPPPGPSTFFDWINQGLIVKARGIKGYYLLNATRVRLGMNPIDTELARKQLGKPTDIKLKEKVETTAPMPSDNELRSDPPANIDVKQAAVYLNVSETSVRRQISRGQMPYVRLGKRRILLRRKDLDRFLEENMQ